MQQKREQKRELTSLPALRYSSANRKRWFKILTHVKVSCNSARWFAAEYLLNGRSFQRATRGAGQRGSGKRLTAAEVVLLSIIFSSQR